MPLESPYRNPGRWRAVANHQDNRHGTAGCLLSLVLLAPLLTPVCGVGVVLVGVLVYSCVVVPALANYYSFSRLLLRSLKLLGHGGRTVGRGGEHLPGYLWLVLLVLAPYLVHVLRNRPYLLVVAGVIYATLVVPLAMKGQLYQGSLLWLPRTVIALLMLRSGFYSGLASKIGEAMASACYYMAGGLRVMIQCLLMALLLPFTFVRTLVPLVHNFYLSFEAFRVTSNQRRQWGQNLNSTNLRDFMRLTAWYMAVRLGKGVALSFILVMFTVEFRHGEPQLSYIAVTFVYFSITQHKWTGNERIISWLKSLSLDIFEEEEELWVPLTLKAGTVLASVAVAAPLTSSLPTLCAVAAYSNVVVPLVLLRVQFETHHRRILSKYRRATQEEISAHSTCPVCLETLKVARATPCNHLYHATCLRRCLELSPLCPMCKQTIL
ncbi:uncharacterized protein LOC122249821 isoform X2 [Penaeus japonicus]|uniref:uncharacterized protein LOC122249821 isoform X2 n=1 Tax=Penaeus japonicus TaxID=27405 RepID=UPI001C71189A|nr:uncharacterized protein LOC122249821 isoform X2 [Penaeus japonicus]